MDLDDAIDLLPRLLHRELDQEYGFTHRHEVMRSRAYLTFGLSSVRHNYSRLGPSLALRLY